MRRILAVLVLAIGFLPMASTVSHAQDGGVVGIRLVDAPVDRRDDPRAQTAIVDHLPVLSAIERRVEVSNTTDEPQEVQLYAAAADATADGWEVAGGREQNDLSSWVTVDPPVVTVPAGGAELATVTIDVPADAPQREHYAVVWAELPPGEGQVTVISRVGIRLYVSVGSGEEPESSFTVDTLTGGRDADGAPVVRAKVTNTGGRALDLLGELRLADGPGGLAAGPFLTPSISTLGIGEEAPVVVTLDPELPAGPWLATVTMTSGRLEQAVEATITFPDEPDVFADPVEAVPVRPGGPIGPIVAGFVLLLTSALLLVVWRRHREVDDERVPEPA